MIKFNILLFLTLSIADSALATAAPPRIITTIKPLHSIVSGITEGISEPELLIATNQSPHHYSLRPSERRKLDNADLILWIGPTMESFMPRFLHSLDNKNAVSLIQTHGLKLFPIRQKSHSGGDDEHHHETHHEHSNIDPHIWLNTHNVDTLIDAITEQIIHIDPEHKQQYKANSKKLHQRTSLLRNNLQQSLSIVSKPFLTYHDGYQYFEHEFGLNNAGFISSSELQPGARRIGELKKLIREQNIECVFYDAPVEPPVLKPLLTNTKTRALMLDPVGILIPSGKDAWFEIMHLLGRQFIKCQQDS